MPSTLRSTSLRLLVLATTGVLLAACGGGSLGGGTAAQGSSDSVKVGLLVAQSGVYSSVGRDMENGIKFYLDQHGNKVGGKTVDLVTVDEGATPQSGVAGVTRLVQQDQVNVVLGLTAGPTASGGRNIFDSNKVPALMGNTGAVALGKDQASPYIWRASYDNAQPGQSLGKKLATDPAAGKVYLIGADYSGGHETIDGFKETFPKDRIAGEVYTPFGKTSDYSSYLAQIKASGAKSVFCFYAGSEAIDFTKQFKQFGLADSVKLYSAGFLTEGSALTAEGDAALGVLNSTRYNWDIDTPVNKTFAPAYEQKYGAVPTVYAATMYDIGIILDKAISQVSGPVNSASINDALGKVGTFEGARGTLSFDNTRTIKQHFYLTEVKKTDAGLRNVTIGTLPNP